jgi:hypothetical protein
MVYLILSLIFATSQSNDVVNSLVESVLAPASSPIKITRTHMNSESEELFKEYIYKDGDKIRIDKDYGDSTVTTFVYDGKTGYKINLEPVEEKVSVLPQVESLEMILYYSFRKGYLSTIEKISDSYYNGRYVTLATGRQGNILYLDSRTHLPVKFEWLNEVVEFEEYNKIDGFGEVPFKIAKTIDGATEMLKITDIQEQVSIPKNFFSVPKFEVETADERRKK